MDNSVNKLVNCRPTTLNVTELRAFRVLLTCRVRVLSFGPSDERMRRNRHPPRLYSPQAGQANTLCAMAPKLALSCAGFHSLCRSLAVLPLTISRQPNARATNRADSTGRGPMSKNLPSFVHTRTCFGSQYTPPPTGLSLCALLFVFIRPSFRPSVTNCPPPL